MSDSTRYRHLAIGPPRAASVGLAGIGKVCNGPPGTYPAVSPRLPEK